MSRLKLVLPTPEYKEKLMDYKKEFIESGDSMDGTAGLKNAETFEDWYSAFCDNLSEETVRNGFVPSTTYMAISYEDDRLVGMISIRHRRKSNYTKVLDKSGLNNFTLKIIIAKLISTAHSVNELRFFDVPNQTQNE